ncbi:tetraspanin-8-like [Carcharodon carcharias]|uniref:tetraspanin-8-like n=1 Tax=Carcharodon carcharias TaxID=13397 RepID=UPI001B7DFC1F|nr:tetraspanin-8-like [Carcharodon carcharias]
MAGVNTCIKYSMFFFNFLFWLCGSVILGISIWMRVSKDAKETIGVNIAEFYPAINLLLAVGSIIMVLGFLGCCGAIKESKCMLLLFFIGLLLILVLQITAGILGAVYSSQVASMIKDKYQDYVPLSGQPDKIRKEIEVMQQELKCCGLFDGYKDWKHPVPSSCDCKTDQSDPTLCVTIEVDKSVWSQSCVSALVDLLKANLVIIIGIAFGLAVIEIFGLAFSMTLYCQIKNK